MMATLQEAAQQPKAVAVTVVLAQATRARPTRCGFLSDGSPDYFGCATAPEGVEVEYFINDAALASCGYAYPSTGGGCETEELIATFEQHTGLSMASFAGCYQSTAFTISR